MMMLRHFILFAFSAALAFGCSGCTEKQGDGPVDNGPVDDSSVRPDLMTLFYETIEKQDKVNPREKVTSVQ